MHAACPTDVAASPQKGSDSPDMTTATAPSMSPRESLADHLHEAILEAATTIEGGPLDGREVVELEQVNRIFLRENWPPIDFGGADVRTPARIVVEARCPKCYQTASILMTVNPILTVDQHTSTLKLKATAKPATHTCGQVSAELGANGAEQIVFDFEELRDVQGLVKADVLRDLLLLVGEDVAAEIIDNWTEPQREEVSRWAGAVHLAASDEEVDVPARPELLGPEKPAEDVEVDEADDDASDEGSTKP